MRIGLTDNLNPEKFEQYGRWILSANPLAEIVKLSPTLTSKGELAGLDGLVLTGGGDVDPEYYGYEDVSGLAREINRARDEFEFQLIERALDREIPILGVCRGMQIMNVYLGGTLVPDLRKAGHENHERQQGRDGEHLVMPVPHTLVAAITGLGSQAVNSAHHQAVEHLGRGLMASAVSKDGVIEAAEWSLKDNMPFLLLVQWHPERMEAADSACARGVAEIFVREVQHRQSHGNQLSPNTQETTE